MQHKRKLFFILLISFGIAISKAIQYPKDWALAHWLVGYQFGFIKRGFPGAVLNIFTEEGSVNECIISVVSIVLFSFFCFLLIRTCFLIFNRNDMKIDDYVILFIFCSSGYITYSAYLMGYYDNIIIIIIFGVLYLLNSNRILMGSILLSIAILIHESSIIFCLPLAFFILTVQNNQYLNNRILVLFLRFMMLPASMVLLIFFNNTSDTMSSETLKDYLNQYPFLDRNLIIIVSDAFVHSFTSYFQSEIIQFPKRVANPFYWIKYGIPVLSIAFIVWKKLNLEGKTKTIIFLMFLSCVFAPLSLLAIAYDTPRIWSFTMIMTFFSYVILKYHGLLNLMYNGTNLIWIFVFCSFINFIVPARLLDGEPERITQTISTILFIAISISVFLSNNYPFNRYKSYLK